MELPGRAASLAGRHTGIDERALELRVRVERAIRARDGVDSQPRARGPVDSALTLDLAQGGPQMMRVSFSHGSPSETHVIIAARLPFKRVHPS